MELGVELELGKNMIENILYPTEKIKFHVCTYVYAMISIV